MRTEAVFLIDMASSYLLDVHYKKVSTEDDPSFTTWWTDFRDWSLSFDVVRSIMGNPDAGDETGSDASVFGGAVVDPAFRAMLSRYMWRKRYFQANRILPTEVGNLSMYHSIAGEIPSDFKTSYINVSTMLTQTDIVEGFKALFRNPEFVTYIFENSNSYIRQLSKINGLDRHAGYARSLKALRKALTALKYAIASRAAAPDSVGSAAAEVIRIQGAEGIISLLLSLFKHVRDFILSNYSEAFVSALIVGSIPMTESSSKRIKFLWGPQRDLGTWVGAKLIPDATAFQQFTLDVELLLQFIELSDGPYGRYSAVGNSSQSSAPINMLVKSFRDARGAERSRALGLNDTSGEFLFSRSYEIRRPMGLDYLVNLNHDLSSCSDPVFHVVLKQLEV